MHAFRYAILIVVLGSILPRTAGAQSGSKSDEVQRLQFYVGTWDEAGQMRDAPDKPFQPVAGGETCTWAAGGSAVLCEEKVAGAGGGWDGVYILNYDEAGGQYHVHGTEAPGYNVHAVGRLDGDRWIWITDPAPDGSRIRYTFAPAGDGARSMVVEAGVDEDWFEIVDITYTPRN